MMNRLCLNVCCLTLFVMCLLSSCQSPPTKDLAETENEASKNSFGMYEVTSVRKLTESDLAGVSDYQLEIIRNEIFARHGYEFKREDLHEYFSHFSWYNANTSDVSDLLSSVEKFNVDFIRKHESPKTNASSSESITSSDDVDSLLDTYEEFVDQYIKYMKKAAKGDSTALADYPELLQKCQEYGDKLSMIQGDFTSAQLERYLMITKKMNNAAQDIQY